jgi:hypothetical protein
MGEKGNRLFLIMKMETNPGRSGGNYLLRKSIKYWRRLKLIPGRWQKY